jgi:hypothetical protein
MSVDFRVTRALQKWQSQEASSNRPTSPVEPRLHDEFVDDGGVDDVCKARRVEFTRFRIHGDLCQLDICADGCEPDVTEPENNARNFSICLLPKNRARGAPFFLDHLKKISVVDDSFENRAKSQSIMSTEGRREPNERNFVFRRECGVRSVGMFNLGMEMRQQPSITMQ